ncbi:uncharacterized protein LOC122076327 [Macadamia integrifolia]|uniref:uncharacterized protein LOC122076327 n=1 Tax=Macadamia integrifolia TaxID=60698 RepID=UPI001C4F4F57|nr:uncharacterized protein LOC122076327 [Macadamia integrifolia]
MATSVNVDEMKWFHTIDRDIFAVLVINLGRDIAESMRIVGLWLWLEEMGYPNIILPMLSCSDTFIQTVAREAVICLNFIDRGELPASEEIPATRNLMNRNISLSFFRDNRVSAVIKISRFISEIGHKAFDDIVERAVKHRASGMGSHGRLRPTGSNIVMGGPGSAFRPYVRERQETGVRHLTPGASSSSGPPQRSEVPLGLSPDQRTLFITFSRGYPISERELRDFFNMKCGGECVEAIYFQEVFPYGQPLFARVIFRSYGTLTTILEGMDEEGKVKLWINGKHARARKYIPRREN